ncbi:MAG TPA: hypothetical protein VEY69_18345 [Lautropia sp.]|nr:hypothetical protein [Lautropia sp.]
MTDRLRELLYPITILAIVGSIYCLALAHSTEREVQRHVRPHAAAIDVETAKNDRVTQQVADIDTRELFD